MKTSGGFTLVEIMIVVAIIGILAAASVPNLLGAIERARKQTCAVNRLNIDGAKLRWSIENSQPASATPTEVDLFGQNPYLEHKPKLPRRGRLCPRRCTGEMHLQLCEAPELNGIRNPSNGG